jgi:hypothetical protein
VVPGRAPTLGLLSSRTLSSGRAGRISHDPLRLKMEGKIMLSYIMIFLAGALLGSMIMGLFVAFVNFRDARDNW